MTKHRTQLFLEAEQYDALARISTTEGCSISQVVRRFVDQGLDRQRQDREQKLHALRHAGSLRRRLEDRYGRGAGEPVGEARAALAGRHEEPRSETP